VTAAITPPEWLTAGAKVAVVQHRPGSSRDEVFLKVVDKVNAKSVTVEGERYPLPSLERRLGGTYGIVMSLADPADASVRAALAEQLRRRRIRRAMDALQKWHDDAERVDLPRDAIAALAPYLNADTEETQP
jgi:hypothetical protein